MNEKRKYSDRQKSILIEIGKKYRPKINNEMIFQIFSTTAVFLLIVLGIFKLLESVTDIVGVYYYLLIIGGFLGLMNLYSYVKKMNKLKKSDDITIGIHYKHRDPSIIGNSKLILSNKGIPAIIFMILGVGVFSIFFLGYLNDPMENIYFIGSVIFAFMTFFSLIWFLMQRFYIFKLNLRKEIYDFELSDDELNSNIISKSCTVTKSMSNTDDLYIEVKPDLFLVVVMYVCSIIFIGMTIVMLIQVEDIISKIVSTSISGVIAVFSLIGIYAGYREKEILTNTSFIKQRLLSARTIDLSDIKMIQYVSRYIKIIGKDNKEIISVLCVNKDISELLDGFLKLGIFIEPLS